jgi:hypothetical protein
MFLFLQRVFDEASLQTVGIQHRSRDMGLVIPNY